MLVFFTNKHLDNKQYNKSKNYLDLSLKDMYSREHAEFITVTCLEWKHLLKEERFKDIIIDSLSFLSKVLFTPCVFYLDHCVKCQPEIPRRQTKIIH